MKIRAKVVVNGSEKDLLIRAIQNGEPIDMVVEVEEQKEPEKAKHLWDIPEVEALSFCGDLAEDVDAILMALESNTKVVFKRGEIAKIAYLIENPEDLQEYSHDEFMKKLMIVLDEHFGKHCFKWFAEEAKVLIS